MKVNLFKNILNYRWSSPSMERYASSLEKHLELLGVEVNSIQPKTSVLFSFLPSKMNFKVSRYYYYPFLASLKREGLNHITDQSFAHLIFSLDKKKTIITAHDLIPLEIERDDFALEMYKRSIEGLKSAAKVIADSEASKKSLIKNLDLNPENIKVIYLGVEKKFTVINEKKYLAEVREKYKIPEDAFIILHVGHNLSYKNIEGIIKSLELFKEKNKEFVFLKVGDDFSSEQKKLISEKGLEKNVLVIGKVLDSELPLIYNLSSVLLYPSLNEGFGFPVLEAMASGLPVVISKEGSLGEIADSAAVYVDPLNYEEIASKLEVVLKEGALREELTRKGLDQAKKFTWEKTAKEVLKVYEEVNND